MAKRLESGDVICEQCGSEYKQIGSHWTRSKDCSHPPISQRDMELLTGLLMGDGSIANKEYKNQYFSIRVIEKDFLAWLDDIFGWLSTGVMFDESAESKAEDARRTGFNPDAKAENYNDMYRLNTRSHPQIGTFNSWYDGSEKEWPHGLIVTPTVLLGLYICDGSYKDDGGHRQIFISIDNEKGNEEKIKRYFGDNGVGAEPDFRQSNSYDMRWGVENSCYLFEYMSRSPFWDGPPAGFEYKFPENFGGTGKTMGDVCE